MFGCRISRLKNSFAGYTLTLMLGNVTSQGITVAGMPILTRLYSPAQFGTFAVFLSAFIVLDKVVTLRYERAIVLAKKENQAINVLSLSVCILLLVCTLFAVASLLLGDAIERIFSDVDLNSAILLLSPMLFISSLRNLMRLWNLRLKKFAALSIARISIAGASVFAKIGFWFLVGSSAHGLIIGEMVGTTVGLIVLAYCSARSLAKVVKDIVYRRMWDMARDYRKFAIYGTPTSILNFVSQEVVVFVLAAFYDSAIVGFYGLANRVVRRPLGSIEESIVNVYYQRAAACMAEKKPIYPGLKKLVLRLACVSIGPTLGILLFAQPLFTYVFGEKWVTTGTYVQVMAPWFFMVFVKSPTNIVFEICQRQEIRLFLNFMSMCLRMGVLILAYLKFQEAFYVVASFSVANFFWEFVTVMVAISMAKTNDRRLEEYNVCPAHG